MSTKTELRLLSNNPEIECTQDCENCEQRVTLQAFLMQNIGKGRRIFTLVASTALISPYRPRFFIYANNGRGQPIDFILTDENTVECIPAKVEEIKKESAG